MTAALSKDEFEVLSRFASGKDLTAIVKGTGLNLDQVSGIVTRFTGLNRQRAAALLREHETVRRNAAVAPPAAPAPAPPAPPRPPARGPAQAMAPATIEALLDAASKTGVLKIERLAARIQAMTDDLRNLVTAHERDAHLREEANRLRARLDEINAALRTTSTRPADTGPDNKTVRAWAEQAGVECPARGRIPAAVLDAYQAAQEAA